MSKQKTLMRIGELAKRTQKTVRALHLYEELDLLAPAERTQSGYRMYDEANIERIEYIVRLQQMGLSLNEIAEVVRSWATDEAPKSAMQNLREFYQERLADVRSKMLDLRALEVELVNSINYLNGCAGCTHDQGTSEVCGTCIRVERCNEERPNLIMGLIAH
jgi:DNA-binding transcriptional MerR regulator